MSLTNRYVLKIVKFELFFDILLTNNLGRNYFVNRLRGCQRTGSLTSGEEDVIADVSWGNEHANHQH